MPRLTQELNNYKREVSLGKKVLCLGEGFPSPRRIRWFQNSDLWVCLGEPEGLHSGIKPPNLKTLALSCSQIHT